MSNPNRFNPGPTFPLADPSDRERTFGPKPIEPDLSGDLSPEEYNRRILAYQRALARYHGA